LLNLHTVRVGIGRPEVLASYAELSTVAKTRGWALFAQKNDLWIAAASLATNSELLTMDKDFLVLRGYRPGWRVTVLDAHTALPVP
jgi:predicted nuclease of predicted toxin-antitoxin system